MKIVAIIQARMGSKRLPGKVLMDVGGKPLLGRVIDRVRHIRSCDEVVVATSSVSGDDIVASYCNNEGVICFRGDETDVLGRYLSAARFIGADTVVRITADCPLIDPEVSEKVIRRFCEGRFDFVSNTLKRTYPDGLDTEVFTYDALDRAHREAILPDEREHVTPYIFSHPELFRLGNVAHDEDRSVLRWTVDTLDDLAFVRAVYERMDEKIFTMNDILTFSSTHAHVSD